MLRLTIRCTGAADSGSEVNVVRYGTVKVVVIDERRSYMPTFGRVAPTIPVADLERALRFYCDVLGFTVSFANGNPATFAVINQGGAELHLGVQPSKAGSSHAHIMVDDLDAVYERLVRASATVRQAPQVQAWGLRDMVIADPDGNTFEIAEPAGERASA